MYDIMTEREKEQLKAELEGLCEDIRVFVTEPRSRAKVDEILADLITKTHFIAYHQGRAAYVSDDMARMVWAAAFAKEAASETYLNENDSYRFAVTADRTLRRFEESTHVRNIAKLQPLIRGWVRPKEG